MSNIKHLISLSDLSDDDLKFIIQRGLGFANLTLSPLNILKNKVIGIYFRKTSTRTRTAFSAAALRMGAQIISYGPNDLQENTGESAEDTGKVLSGMLDCLVMRTAGAPTELRTYSLQKSMAVINAMTEDEHPTQALVDVTTMLQYFGQLRNRTVLYVGEGNNTAVALSLLITRLPFVNLVLCTPPGYGLPTEKFREAVQQCAISRSSIYEYHHMDTQITNVDVVYTSRWQTTGTVKKDLNWRSVFEPFRVDDTLMNRFPNAIFMHDLPANRGEDVTDSVLDGTSSLAFRQAHNKMYSAMAVLEWSLAGGANLCK